MRRLSFLASLRAERQPLAVLAILAALLPSILAGVGALGTYGIRLADGSFVICTGTGFERVADPEANRGRGHHLADCCKAGCVHATSKLAVGPAPIAEPARFAASTSIAWQGHPDAALTVRTAAGPSIRAPPELSA